MVQEKKILPSRVLDDENNGIGLDLGFEPIAGPLWNPCFAHVETKIPPRR